MMSSLGLAFFLGTALAQEPAPAVPGPPVGESLDEIEVLRQEIRELRAEVDSLKQRAPAEMIAPLPAIPPRPPRGPHHAPWEAHAHRSFGGDVVIPEGTEVREAASFGGDIEVLGRVQHGVRSLGGDIIIRNGGEVRGDAESFGGDIIVEPGGALRGRANTLGGELVVHPGGRTGSVLVEGGDTALGAASEAASWVWESVSSFYRWLVFLLAFAGAGVLIVALFPDRVAKVAANLEERPATAGLLGLGGTLVLGLASLLFIWTIVGPVVLLGVLGVAWMLGFVGLCQMLGDRLPFSYKPHGRWLAFLVGSLVISLLGALPWIGTLTVILASLFGIGAALGSRFGSR
jgi:hypothetical protein